MSAACIGQSATTTVNFSGPQGCTLLNPVGSSFVALNGTCNAITVPVAKISFNANISNVLIKTFNITINYTANTTTTAANASTGVISISQTSNTCNADPTSFNSIGLSNTSIVGSAVVMYNCTNSNNLSTYIAYIACPPGTFFNFATITISI